jgi:arylsulfatase B
VPTDNGGEIMAAGSCGGNNWPLTGGKFSNWEGGIRVTAFVAGGALPVARRGRVESGLSTVWDWYATYAKLAGVDPTDKSAAAAGLPPIDSVDLWPLLSGTGAQAMARTEVIIGETTALLPNGDGRTLVGGLIQSAGVSNSSARTLYKLLLGAPDRQYTIDQYVRTGPLWPNSSSHLVPLDHFKVCGRTPAKGCLFELESDPYERTNLALSQADRFASMLARVDELQRHVYSPVRGGKDKRACDAVSDRYDGYWGPFA